MLKPTNSYAVRRRFESHLIPLYAVQLLLILVSTVTAFVHSFYVAQVVSEAAVGVVYLAASCLGLLTFLFISRVLKRLGNYKLMFGLLCLLCLTFLGMAFVPASPLSLFFFLLQFIILPILFYSNDIFLEAELDNKESSTGTKRGLLLTLVGLVAAASPLIMSLAIPDTNNFTYVYTLAAIFTLPVIAILAINIQQFSDPKYTELDVFKAIGSFWQKTDVRNVYLAALTLNLYFAFTVIYLPLYLVGQIGISWEEFGIMMSIGILAYLIFEYPVGVIADRYTGEKEFMALGFLILILTTASVAFVTTTSFLFWVVLMFVTRIGASIVEVTTESYFFKKTKSSDAQIISFFRTTRPVSYVIITVIGSLTLLYLPFNLLYVVAALTMIPALFFTMNLHDTK